MSERPLVSIITPTFNPGDKIRTTIQSVLSQDPSLYEYHVVDGGSTDGIPDLIRTEFPAVDLVSEPDAGIYDAINKGIARSMGRFVYVIGAGDVLRPGVLERMADRLRAMPANSFVYGDVYWVRRNRVYDGPFSKRDIATHCICHQAMFLDRSLFDLIGPYDLRYALSADWVFNVRCFGDPRVHVRYEREVVANYEGGGISDTGVDLPFRADFPSIVRQSLGASFYRLVMRRRVRRRIYELALAVRRRSLGLLGWRS